MRLNELPMANACFRCKDSIPSGETFCGLCRGEVVLDFSPTESRTWFVVAAALALQGIFFAAGLLVYLLYGSKSLVIAAGGGLMLAWIPGIALAYALYRDAAHVRNRDDTDWNPSKWGYIVLISAGLLLVVPVTVLGISHLRKRHNTIGLPHSKY